jgi:hypothetical protein
MVIESTQMLGLRMASNLLLVFLGAIAIYYALLSLPVRKKRWRSLRITALVVGSQLPQPIAKLLLIRIDSKGVEERRQLLSGCGIPMEPTLYEALRRIVILILTALIGMGYAAFHYPSFTLFVNPIYVLAVALCLLIFILFDQKVLAQLKQSRSHRIVKEIYTISQQLLYYTGSQMNLHAKLNRCLYQTRTLKPAFQFLLNEWYQDADAAIYNFKTRLGTDEAHSFGETLNALRLHEDDDYYELLQQRLGDYKEKIELTRESRKEAASYVLFVLAGLPILNTFRVFMYPWIMEGQQLFNSING